MEANANNRKFSPSQLYNGQLDQVGYDVTRLKSECKAAGLKQSGSKHELIVRLLRRASGLDAAAPAAASAAPSAAAASASPAATSPLPLPAQLRQHLRQR